MIIVKNRELLIPNNERYLGTTYDDNSTIRTFRIARFNEDGTDKAQLDFYLIFNYDDGYAPDASGVVKSVSDEYIVLEWDVSEAITEHAGCLFAWVRGFDYTGTIRWSSFPGVFYIEGSGTEPSNLSDLEERISEEDRLLRLAKLYKSQPMTAATVADMKDRERIYVYVGDESGYTYGNWYFWDGSAWVSGGVFNATAYQTDKSLTGSDIAADAKIVGDKLASETTARTNSISSLQAQIDQFVALQDGSTTGDAELQNIRIGANGTSYASAGTAVRTQVTELQDQIDEITTGLGTTYTTLSVTFTDGSRYLMEASKIGQVSDTSTSRPMYKRAKISASPGDLFKVTLATYSADLGHIGFLDSSNILLSYLLDNGNNSAVTVSDYTFTCPANTAYVIFNTVTGNNVIAKGTVGTAASKGYVDEHYELTATSLSYSDEGVSPDEDYLIDLMRVNANSIALNDSAKTYYTRLYTGRYSHDAQMVVVDGIAYTAYLCNANDVGDNPGAINAFVQLGITDITNIRPATITSNTVIAKNGDTVGTMTITSGCGVPNIVHNNGVLHIFFSCRLSDNKWYILKRTYTISSSTLSDIEICKLRVNGTVYDLTSTNFNAYITPCNTATFLSPNAQIAYDGTGYYMAICEHSTIQNPAIMYSTDLNTWELFTIPPLSAHANFECSCYYYNSKIYLAVRQQQAYGKMILATVDPVTKTVLDRVDVDDCGARACYFEYGDALYLIKSGKSRHRNDILKVGTTFLALTRIVYQSIVQMVYPSVAVYDGEVFLTSTGNHSMYVYLRKLAFGSYTTDNIYDMFVKMIENYLS